MKTILPKFIDSYGDSRGGLYAIENIKQFIPFEINRFYFITGSNTSSKRGGHGHKNLKQFFVLANGYVELLINQPNSTKKTKIIFDTPGQFFYLEQGFFRELLLNDDSILLVFASDNYDEGDYF